MLQGLRSRLRRVQAAVDRRQPMWRAWPDGLDGSDPPCPPWIDPEQWASRQRVGKLLMQRVRGEVGPGRYPPHTPEEDISFVETVVANYPSHAGAPTEVTQRET